MESNRQCVLLTQLIFSRHQLQLEAASGCTHSKDINEKRQAPNNNQHHLYCSTPGRTECVIISHTHNINMLPAWLVVCMSPNTCWLTLCLVGFWKLPPTSPRLNFNYKQDQSVSVTFCYHSYLFELCCWASLLLNHHSCTNSINFWGSVRAHVVRFIL